MSKTIKRHTHRMCEGLEDATAIALDITFESQAPKTDDPLKYISQRASRLIQILKILRIGPDAYNSDELPRFVIRRKTDL
jgi:hypothetical protein